jgi:hypothetical protein
MNRKQAKSIMITFVAAMAGLLTTAPAMSQEPPEPPRLPRSLAALAAEAEFSTEQKSQLAALASQRAEAAGQWHQANDQKLDELNKVIAAARAANRHHERVEALRQRAALLAEIRGIEAGYDAQIRGLMTGEQLIRWDAAVLLQGELLRLRRAGLSNEQREQVKAKAAAASAAIHAVEGTEEQKTQQAEQLRRQFVADVHQNVLTEPQRTAVAPAHVQGVISSFGVGLEGLVGAHGHLL